MGNADKFDERDERIKQLLLSSDEAKRKDGMDRVIATFRRPVASVLVSKAREGQSLALEILLDPRSGTLDPEVFGEVWQETAMCMWKNVKNNEFESNGSLLSYLIQIASCRTVDLWRKQRKRERGIDSSVEVELCCDTPTERREELLEAIDLFYDKLSEQDQAILRLGLKLVDAYGSGRRIRAELAAMIDRICREREWKKLSVEAIARRYGRLLKRLREFLIERGYHV